MTNVFDILKERGFIEQCTHENEIRELLEKEKVTFYTGYDATADSLTAGHFLTVMAAAHMQRAGHVPIILIGGGTTMIGDPTGKSDMRKMLTLEQINHNAECFKRQLSKFIDFSDNKAIMINNAEWLLELNYISLLREIGVHFSVNRMLTFDCYKSRMEKGLSFLEFNYMIMQSYDFLELNRRFGCKLQTGGNDQWSNILGGVELIRRKEQKEAFGLTFTLLTTSEGKKMGKTERGAVWLDPDKTSPFEFYQYWRNVNDADVIKCLKLLTFVPMEEINELAKLKDQEINKAKMILAYELTKIVHGEEEAQKAKQAAEALFSTGGPAGDMPTTEIDKAEADNSINILDLLVLTNLAKSKGEARRLIDQGGIYIDGNRIESLDFSINSDSFSNNEILIRKGKKIYHKVIIK